MTNLSFIDLFAGIGGFRLGMENAGYDCVFSSEIDKHACEMYLANFKENPFKDITSLNTSDIPDFDVLCGGFPCQAFSISGKRLGFADKTRGSLFFDICRVLEFKKPRAFILENVKNLKYHDAGNTLKVILDNLDNLGYNVTYEILSAKDFGLPQHRERIILVGILKSENKYFSFNNLVTNKVDSMLPFLDNDREFDWASSDSYTLLEESVVKRQKSDLMFSGYLNKKFQKKGNQGKYPASIPYS